jgi:hypothetical protein
MVDGIRQHTYVCTVISFLVWSNYSLLLSSLKQHSSADHKKLTR